MRSESDVDLPDPIDLPGGEIFVAGMRDLRRGRITADVAAVLSVANRLAEAGIAVPEAQLGEPPAHKLYHLLQEEDPAGAYGRYKATLRRMQSLCNALDHARRRHS